MRGRQWGPSGRRRCFPRRIRGQPRSHPRSPAASPAPGVKLLRGAKLSVAQPWHVLPWHRCSPGRDGCQRGRAFRSQACSAWDGVRNGQSMGQGAACGAPPVSLVRLLGCSCHRCLAVPQSSRLACKMNQSQRFKSIRGAEGQPPAGLGGLEGVQETGTTEVLQTALGRTSCQPMDRG